MQTPKNVKDIQRLSECVAYLSMFLSKLGEKNLPLYKLLKGTSPFAWIDDYEKAFSALKLALSQVLILEAPKEGEILFMYLVVTETVLFE